MTKTKEKLRFSYNPETDVMEIEGMRYTGSLFRSFAAGGLALETPMKIVKRDNGVITLQTIAEEEKVAAALAPVKAELVDLSGLMVKVRTALRVPENVSILDWAPKVIQFRDLPLRSVTRCAGVGSPILCQCATAHKKHQDAIPEESTT